MSLKALRPTHFSPSDSPERRAALLNALRGDLAQFWTAVNMLIGGGVVTSFTAGAGMVDSGTASEPIADIQAADATIVVNADSIQVGTITGANVADGSISSDDVDDSIVTVGDMREMAELSQELVLLLHDMVRVEMGQAPQTGLVG